MQKILKIVQKGYLTIQQEQQKVLTLLLDSFVTVMKYYPSSLLRFRKRGKQNKGTERETITQTKNPGMKYIQIVRCLK